MKAINYVLMLILFPLLMVDVVAQKVSPPQPGKARDFSLPDIKTFKLDNGMNSTLVQFGEIPKATIRLVIRAGNIDEAENQVWLADFTCKLMKEGTKTRSAQKIADEAASMGGNINISSGAETTEISADVLSEFAPRMIELLADVVMNPIFPDSEIPRIKSDLIRDLNMQKSQPENLAYELFAKIIYPGHPFGRIFPDEGTINSFDARMARKFHEENFGAARAHLYVAGSFKEAEVEKKAREVFASWKKGNDPVVNIPAKAGKPGVYFVDRPGSPQAVVNIGLQVIDPSDKDYLPLVLTNSLLGGSFTSRITMNIREDKGYTYSPYSRVQAKYRNAVWIQYAEIATNVTVPAIKEIFKEISRLTTDSIGSKELKGIKNYVSGMFVLSNSTREGIINQLAFIDLHGLDIDYLRNYVKNIQAIKADEIHSIMKKYLDPARMIIVIAGDKRKVEQQGPLKQRL